MCEASKEVPVIRTTLTFVGLAVAMALINIYTTLATGWGDGGSIISVILATMFLAGPARNIITLNLAQTKASAGGSIGFVCATLAAVYYNAAQHDHAWTPNLPELSILLIAVGILGVLLAVPMRCWTIHWFFPSAVACATVLFGVTEDDPAKRKRAKSIMLKSGAIASLLALPTKVATSFKGAPIWKTLSVGKVSVALDPLFFGIGMVVGPRIGLTMAVGSAILTFVLVPHWSEDPGMGDNIGLVVKWGAVGFMTIPAFADLIFAKIFGSGHSLPAGFEAPVNRAEKYTRLEVFLLGVVGVVCVGVTVIFMERLFGAPWKPVLITLVLAAPLCLVLGKVASDTDINPVRLLASILLAVVVLFGKYTATVLLGVGIVGSAFAAIAVDLFYDLRTGYLVGAPPKRQVWLQLVGVVVAAFPAVYVLNYFATHFGFGEGKYFQAPGAVVWSTMADGFADPKNVFTPFVLKVLAVTSAVGVVMSFLANHPKTKKYAPSSMALGIAMLLDPDNNFAIAAGSMVLVVSTFLALRRNKSEANVLQGEARTRITTKYKHSVVQAGSAVFAASGLMGIISAGFIALGLFHVPDGKKPRNILDVHWALAALCVIAAVSFLFLLLVRWRRGRKRL